MRPAKRPRTYVGAWRAASSSLRNGGKLCFATLMDGEGNKIQVMLSASPAVGAAVPGRLQERRRPGRPPLRPRPRHLLAPRRAVDLRDPRRGHARGTRPPTTPRPPTTARPRRLVGHRLQGAAPAAQDLDHRGRRRDHPVRGPARPPPRARPASRAPPRATWSASARPSYRSIRENFFRRDYIELETPDAAGRSTAVRPRAPSSTHMNALRHRSLPAHRDGDLPQARGGRRRRPRLRDEP